MQAISRLALLAAVAAFSFTSSSGCSSGDSTGAGKNASGGDEIVAEKSEDKGKDSAAADEPTDVFEPLEPYDPPPLAEIDAKAGWIDQRVADGIQVLREKLKQNPPLVDEAAALSRRNNGVEDNEAIYSVMRQLPASDDDVDYEATFVHWVAGEAKSLNPLMINLEGEMELLALTGLQLLSFDADFKPFAPSWAVKSWQASADHMMDKFVLRDDLTWSDGKPLTAHDVVFAFQTIMKPTIPIPALRTNMQHLRWIEAYDDHTLVMFHKEPMASWTENIQFPVIPRHIYEKSLDEDPTMVESDYHLKYDRQPVTCGPYEYVSRERGQETVVRRRESWYMHNGEQVRPKPFLKEIRFKVIVDPNTALLALKAGEVDECRLTPEQWITQSGDDDFYNRNVKVNGLEWTEYHIVWNCQTPLFSDKRVRQAMAYAFDMKEMVSSIFYDLVLPGQGLFHPTAWMSSKTIKPIYQDLDRAEELLDEAGWVDSDGDGVRDKTINGRSVPLEFTVLAYEQPAAIKMCTLLKNNLEQIGVVCHVKPTEFTVKSQFGIEHKFQALQAGWGTGTDPSTLDNAYKTGQGRNFGLYSNPRVDELFEAGQREYDRDKRAAIYAEIQEVMFEDQPCLWLYHRKSLYGVNEKLRGFNFSPRDPYGVEPGFHALWVPKND
jgi:peptide/nickel transport system substrate-binding protein